MKEVSPLVSILVPVYKAEKYIERCARSLFEQTYPNLEFIFVDDASPDKSIEILQKVIQYYPKWQNSTLIIHHHKNRGIAAARNTLIDNCKGEFLFHVDSDDWIEPNAIELLMERQLETDADIVSGKYYRHTINEEQEESIIVVPSSQGKDKEETLKVMLKYRSIVATWNRLIRSSLYHDNNIRYAEGIDAGEDLMITPRLVYYSRKVASCNSITYHYNRNNPNSCVSGFKHSWDMQLQLIKACQMNVDFFSHKEEYFKEAMNRQFVQRLKNISELTFMNRNRKGYNAVVGLLDETDRKYWTLIGWDRPIKRWLDHHFIISHLLIPLRIMHSEIQKLMKSYISKKKQKE